MSRISWRDLSHGILRVVLSADLPAEMSEAIRMLADKFRIVVVRSDTNPRPGDLWVGCQPEAGWSSTDNTSIMAVHAFEIPIVLVLFRQASVSIPSPLSDGNDGPVVDFDGPESQEFDLPYTVNRLSHCEGEW